MFTGPSILTNGLVLALDAANSKSYPGSGTTWSDMSGNGNNGTLTNGPTFSNNSIVFDGVDDYVSSNNGLTNNSDFSVLLWINYRDVLNASRGIITTWGTSWNGFGIASQNTGLIRSWTNNGAGGGMNWGSLIQNSWNQLVLTYTFSNKTQIGYVNGQSKVSESFGTAISHSTLQIARGGQTASTQLSLYPNTNCVISNVSIYNRTLTSSEVAQNYNAQKSRFNL